MYEDILTNKGIELLNVKKTLNNLDDNSKNIILSQFPKSIIHFFNIKNDDEFIESIIKHDSKYGDYKKLIAKNIDKNISDLTGLKNYVIVNDLTLRVEKVKRFNSDFFKNEFDIDLSLHTSKQYDDFIKTFIALKAKAMKNKLLSMLDKKVIDVSKNPLKVNVVAEKRKLVFSLNINKNDDITTITKQTIEFLQKVEQLLSSK